MPLIFPGAVADVWANKSELCTDPRAPIINIMLMLSKALKDHRFFSMR
jgi:hypothetical protein